MSHCELGIIGVKKTTSDQLGVVKPDNSPLLWMRMA